MLRIQISLATICIRGETEINEVFLSRIANEKLTIAPCLIVKETGYKEDLKPPVLLDTKVIVPPPPRNPLLSKSKPSRLAPGDVYISQPPEIPRDILRDPPKPSGIVAEPPQNKPAPPAISVNKPAIIPDKKTPLVPIDPEFISSKEDVAVARQDQIAKMKEDANNEIEVIGVPAEEERSEMFSKIIDNNNEEQIVSAPKAIAPVESPADQPQPEPQIMITAVAPSEETTESCTVLPTHPKFAPAPSTSTPEEEPKKPEQDNIDEIEVIAVAADCEQSEVFSKNIATDTEEQEQPKKPEEENNTETEVVSVAAECEQSEVFSKNIAMNEDNIPSVVSIHPTYELLETGYKEDLKPPVLLDTKVIVPPPPRNPLLSKSKPSRLAPGDVYISQPPEIPRDILRDPPKPSGIVAEPPQNKPAPPAISVNKPAIIPDKKTPLVPIDPEFISSKEDVAVARQDQIAKMKEDANNEIEVIGVPAEEERSEMFSKIIDNNNEEQIVSAPKAIAPVESPADQPQPEPQIMITAVAPSEETTESCTVLPTHPKFAPAPSTSTPEEEPKKPEQDNIDEIEVIAVAADCEQSEVFSKNIATDTEEQEQPKKPEEENNTETEVVSVAAECEQSEVFSKNIAMNEDNIPSVVSIHPTYELLETGYKEDLKPPVLLDTKVIVPPPPRNPLLSKSKPSRLAPGDVYISQPPEIPRDILRDPPKPSGIVAEPPQNKPAPPAISVNKPAIIPDKKTPLVPIDPEFISSKEDVAVARQDQIAKMKEDANNEIEVIGVPAEEERSEMFSKIIDNNNEEQIVSAPKAIAPVESPADQPQPEPQIMITAVAPSEETTESCTVLPTHPKFAPAPSTSTPEEEPKKPEQDNIDEIEVIAVAADCEQSEVFSKNIATDTEEQEQPKKPEEENNTETEVVSVAAECEQSEVFSKNIAMNEDNIPSVVSIHPTYELLETGYKEDLKPPVLLDTKVIVPPPPRNPLLSKSKPSRLAPGDVYISQPPEIPRDILRDPPKPSGIVAEPPQNKPAPPAISVNKPAIIPDKKTPLVPIDPEFISSKEDVAVARQDQIAKMKEDANNEIEVIGVPAEEERSEMFSKIIDNNNEEQIVSAPKAIAPVESPADQPQPEPQIMITAVAPSEETTESCTVLPTHPKFAPAPSTSTPEEEPKKPEQDNIDEIEVIAVAADCEQSEVFSKNIATDTEEQEQPKKPEEENNTETEVVSVAAECEQSEVFSKNIAMNEDNIPSVVSIHPTYELLETGYKEDLKPPVLLDTKVIVPPPPRNPLLSKSKPSRLAPGDVYISQPPEIPRDILRDPPKPSGIVAEPPQNKPAPPAISVNKPAIIPDKKTPLVPIDPEFISSKEDVAVARQDQIAKMKEDANNEIEVIGVPAEEERSEMFSKIIDNNNEEQIVSAPKAIAPVESPADQPQPEPQIMITAVAPSEETTESCTVLPTHPKFAPAPSTSTPEEEPKKPEQDNIDEIEVIAVAADCEQSEVFSKNIATDTEEQEQPKKPEEENNTETEVVSVAAECEQSEVFSKNIAMNEDNIPSVVSIHPTYELLETGYKEDLKPPVLLDTKVIVPPPPRNPLLSKSKPSRLAPGDVYISQPPEIPRDILRDPPKPSGIVAEPPQNKPAPPAISVNKPAIIPDKKTPLVPIDPEFISSKEDVAVARQDQIAKMKEDANNEIEVIGVPAEEERSEMFSKIIDNNNEEQIVSAPKAIAPVESPADQPQPEQLEISVISVPAEEETSQMFSKTFSDLQTAQPSPLSSCPASPDQNQPDTPEVTLVSLPADQEINQTYLYHPHSEETVDPPIVVPASTSFKVSVPPPPPAPSAQNLVALTSPAVRTRSGVKVPTAPTNPRVTVPAPSPKYTPPAVSDPKKIPPPVQRILK
jgi:hypothetical protein